MVACRFQRFAARLPTGGHGTAAAWRAVLVLLATGSTARKLLLLDLSQKVMPHASTSPPAIATKLVIDQFMFAPACTVSRACKRRCFMSMQWLVVWWCLRLSPLVWLMTTQSAVVVVAHASQRACAGCMPAPRFWQWGQLAL